ncbi:unnamed protein product [Meloidogyne enterolobii]|uniref:Uncharacterized protein n=1 Tax=Meloidogyne enterolobii TaxID=390850 RepID=A0ACB0Y9U5_MELEN
MEATFWELYEAGFERVKKFKESFVYTGYGPNTCRFISCPLGQYCIAGKFRISRNRRKTG